MQNITVSSKEYLSGIPLPDFSAVRSALTQVSEGISVPFSGVRAEFIYDDVGIIGAKETFVESASSRYLETLFRDIQEGLADRDHFDRVVKDLSSGALYGIGVSVDLLPHGGYMLSLSAPFIGSDEEIPLASALGVERCLWWTTVYLTLDEPVDELVAIDFKPIARALNAFSDAQLTGTVLAETISAGQFRASSLRSGGTCIVRSTTKQSPGILVSMDSHTVKDYFIRPYKHHGSILDCASRTKPSNHAVKEKPAISILIEGKRPEVTHSWQRLPILDLEIQKDVRFLADAITSSFNS